MNCVLCKHGDAQFGTVTVSLNRGETRVVIKNVPALVCENCGEYYLDNPIATHLYEHATAAVMRHAEVENLHWQMLAS